MMRIPQDPKLFQDPPKKPYVHEDWFSGVFEEAHDLMAAIGRWNSDDEMECDAWRIAGNVASKRFMDYDEQLALFHEILDCGEFSQED